MIAFKCNADELPIISLDEFTNTITTLLPNQYHLSNYFIATLQNGQFLFAILLKDNNPRPVILRTPRPASLPSKTDQYPQFHLFERLLQEKNGINVTNHPRLHPVRFVNQPIGDINYFSIEGDSIHEVGVGPVHAGVIEPGHFRFSCHGEEVFHLEISLGYQHRGLEKQIINTPLNKQLYLMETIAGDSTIAHSWCYASMIEKLLAINPSTRHQQLRAIALELERMANHTGDLGALSGDVGFLPTAAFCGRLRGDLLNMSALMCGSRFGRGMIKIGGVNFDINEQHQKMLGSRIKTVYRDISGALHLLFENKSVLRRFEDTGTINNSDARKLGLVGMAARASGIESDLRTSFDLPLYHKLKIAGAKSGDVLARAEIRRQELDSSYEYILNALTKLSLEESLPEQTPDHQSFSLPPDHLAFAFVEAWRGECCHALTTDGHGKIQDYSIVDASFHNWEGLAFAMRNQEISDFPLCNKSFNLSYCGHDL